MKGPLQLGFMAQHNAECALRMWELSFGVFSVFLVGVHCVVAAISGSWLGVGWGLGVIVGGLCWQCSWSVPGVVAGSSWM